MVRAWVCGVRAPRGECPIMGTATCHTVCCCRSCCFTLLYFCLYFFVIIVVVLFNLGNWVFHFCAFFFWIGLLFHLESNRPACADTCWLLLVSVVSPAGWRRRRWCWWRWWMTRGGWRFYPQTGRLILNFIRLFVLSFFDFVFLFLKIHEVMHWKIPHFNWDIKSVFGIGLEDFRTQPGFLLIKLKDECLPELIYQN